MKIILERWRKWLLFNGWYLQRPPWDTEMTPPEVEAYVQQHPAGRALELGCGSGLNAVRLGRAGWEVVGVDFALRAVGRARQRAAQAGVQGRVRFLTGDVTRLEGVEGPFDLVLDIGCFHTLSPQGQQAVLDRLEQLLTPGGEFLLYAWIQVGAGMGVNAEGIARIQERFRLVQRADGWEHAGQPSTWFVFAKTEG
ncbi:class I SAM-dependent methyltransferase [Levilinea saccharolytica]|uniref:class I SAM-dependent methyltransferase n=1 Tax=Levilinea saccharolytica TaxID=229921 RepID=UPI000781E53D|nr:class I SAM-dependent methyltransferase [Levilinea saccharolytica]GAP18605.1 protein containing methyltransferase domain [Levilinea saccharolytica]